MILQDNAPGPSLKSVPRSASVLQFLTEQQDAEHFSHRPILSGVVESWIDD